MELILTEDVANLGKRGAVVKVADGFGRNFLIPKGLAVVATQRNLKQIEEQRIALAKKDAQFKEEAEILANELNQLHVVLSRKAGETGVLFGSVTTKDIADLMEANGINVDRRKLVLEHPLKQVGNFEVEIHPYTEVTASILVSVAVEEDAEVARLLKRGPESEAVVAEVQASLEGFEKKAAAQMPAAAESVAEEATPEEAESEKED
jgi:large subunit ribosomal protein L9